ncbi:MAG TPA: hypothetical protein PLG34_13640 [Spirochaetota bacterium]|nr:hypothetical protein [Spirochaetota bacterium]
MNEEKILDANNGENASNEEVVEINTTLTEEEALDLINEEDLANEEVSEAYDYSKEEAKEVK